MQPLHIVGEIDVSFHKLPPRGRTIIGMLLLLCGGGKALADSGFPKRQLQLCVLQGLPPIPSPALDRQRQ
jgi:hypothetical protein